MPDYTVLIASSSDMNRTELAERFRDQCDVLEVNSVPALEQRLNRTPEHLAAIIIDASHVPEDGLKALQMVRKRHTPEEMPVFLIVNDISNNVLERGYTMGATDVIVRPYTKFAHRRVMNVIQLHELGYHLQWSLTEAEEARNAAINQQAKARRAQEQAERAQAQAEQARAVAEAAQERAEQAQAEAEAARDVSEHFLKRMPGGMFRYKADGREDFELVSDGLVEMFGCDSVEDFRKHIGNSFMGFVHPDDLDRVEHDIWAQIGQNVSFGNDKVTYRIIRKDGTVRWVEDFGRYIVDDTGQAWFYVVVLDITEKIEYQNELKRSNDRLRILSELSNDVIFDVNMESETAEVFGDFEKRFGRPMQARDFIRLAETLNLKTKSGNTLSITAHEPAGTNGESQDINVAILNAAGEPTWCRYQSVVFSDSEEGNAQRYVGRLLDTHEMMMQQLAYQSRAEHDPLTGAYNREAAISKITELTEAKGGPHALLFIDVDDFKGINDTYGHPVGDLVLAHVAKHLKSLVRENDVVARFGGDEFAVFLQGMGEGDRLRQIVGAVSKGTFSDFKCEEIKNPGERLSLSIGVSCAPADGVPFEVLYETADNALYEVKRGGKNSFLIRSA